MAPHGRDRTRAIPEIDASEARAIGDAFEWLDGSFPQGQVREVLGDSSIDFARFAAFFGRRLALYRADDNRRQQARARKTTTKRAQRSAGKPAPYDPTPQELREWVDGVVRIALQLQLRLECVPVSVRSMFDDAAIKSGTPAACAELRSLPARLDAIVDPLQTVAARLSRIKQPGRKSDGARRALLRDVAEWLQLHDVRGVTRSAGMAANCLLAAGVIAPTTDKKAREDVLRAQRERPAK